MRPLALVAALLAALLTVIALGRAQDAPPQSSAASAGARDGFDINWPGYEGRAFRVRESDGSIHYEVTRRGGTAEALDAAEFADRYFEEKRKADELGPVARLIRARSPAEFAWILFGLAGQVLFAGRMVVQWIVSERRKESFVPPIFWWMSLTGSAMLLTYFTWRWDVVGMLGQGLPFIIYIRNLMLIYGGPSEDPEIANA